jgi:hypothetical protein
MKRVRYAIGAIGVAPVLGLIIPAANAMAAVPQISKNAGKSVSLGHGERPLVNCGHNHTKFASGSGLFAGGQIGYSGTTCIHSQWAELDKFQAGLTERVRFYSGAGALERTTWQAGHDIDNQFTFFSSVPNLNGRMACEALVANSNHNDVKYGPVCETT